jgi:hypothetical protein
MVMRQNNDVTTEAAGVVALNNSLNQKDATAFAIFRGKAATKKNRHASRVVILLACSSTNDPNLRRYDRVADAVCH